MRLTEAMTATDALPPCPACAEDYTYEDGAVLVCPMCAHEWNPAETEAEAAEPRAVVVKDAVGNPLADGDDVTIAKDLKVKGGAGIKSGTKVRGIRLPGCRWTATTPRRRPRVWVSCT